MSFVPPATPPVDPAIRFGEPVSERFRDPAGYIADEALEAAVRVALLLGMPLLLTGGPGCGKTSVAAWLAWKLGLGEPLVFNVKSTTSGRDLLYEFDELGRFRDAQVQTIPERDESHYVRLNALGLAIALTGRPESPLGGYPLTHGELVARSFPGEAPPPAFERRRVVLIDELDKAPRDTPNDLLLEILEMKFLVRELDAWVTGAPALRPVVVITSNSEKSLPEPFLRRCVFHHIQAPGEGQRRDIVASRQHPFARRGALFDQAMQLFERLSDRLGRAPGTAELLAWLTVLEDRVRRHEGAPPRLADIVADSLGVLAKTTEDLQRAEAEANAAPLDP